MFIHFFFTYVQGVYINATCTDDGTVHGARLLEIMVLKRLISHLSYDSVKCRILEINKF